MLIITGTIAYDYIMDFPGSFADHILPEQIHKINLSFIVNKFAKRRGGTAGNVSYSLGLLGTENILFSVAGKDFSEYKKPFAKLPVDMSKVVINKKDYTATGFAMTDKTNNQIWGYFYGAADGIADLQLNTVSKKDDLVLIGPSGAAGSLSLLNQCVQLKLPYMFDPGFILTQVNDADLLFGVENAEYIIGNDYEINLIRSRLSVDRQGLKNAEKLFANKILITTLGEKGAEILKDGKTYTIPVVAPKRVVDPTGAGDAWRSGFLAGVVRNFDMQTCGQLGSVAASFALEEYGTQEHTYTIKEFQKRYRQAFGTLVEL